MQNGNLIHFPFSPPNKTILCALRHIQQNFNWINLVSLHHNKLQTKKIIGIINAK